MARNLIFFYKTSNSYLNYSKFVPNQVLVLNTVLDHSRNILALQFLAIPLRWCLFHWRRSSSGIVSVLYLRSRCRRGERGCRRRPLARPVPLARGSWTRSVSMCKYWSSRNKLSRMLLQQIISAACGGRSPAALLPSSQRFGTQ